MRQIERLKDRIMAGMSYEAAYGLEYMLARRDEGFNGRSWRDPNQYEPKSIKAMVSAIKLVEKGPIWTSELNKHIGGVGSFNLDTINRLLKVDAIRVVKTKNGIGRLVEISDGADEFMDEHDTQKSMFD